MRRVRLPALLAASGMLALLAGCGAETSESSAPDRGETPSPTPLARIAVADEIRHLDPIYVENRAEQLVSRQIYDPLVSRLDPPLGAIGRRRGPARPIGPEADGRLWRFQLRPDAQFQDGTAIDAEAVGANVERWLTSGIAARLLPELDAIDSPLPGEVRFQLSAPVPELPRRLSDPRLGLVSPNVLLDSGPGEVEGGSGGSGAYEPRLTTADRALLSASGDWWGRAAGLGPGVARLELIAVPSSLRRLALLRDGVVEIGDDLDAGAAALVGRDPLLISTAQGDRETAASAAVRGLRRGSVVQPLSEVWLTLLR